MMIIRIYTVSFLFFMIEYFPSSALLHNNLSIDCDSEFAEFATKLATEHINDPQIVKYVHAVLSSCNKAPIQKMAEVSVFLLHKGAVTPKVMGEIKAAYEQVQRKKENEMNKKMSRLPPELQSTAQKIRQISTSAGLSGNERRFQIEQALSVVPASYQHQLVQTFDEVSSKLDADKTFERPNEPIEISTPPSFAIPKNIVKNEDENLLLPASSHVPQDHGFSIQEPPELMTVPRVNMPFQPMTKEVKINPQPISLPKQNVLFPDLPPTRPIEPSVHVQQTAMSGIQKLLESPNFDQILSSIVQKGAKIAEGPLGELPKSVGPVDHTKVKQEIGLLNPSMWSDAAKFISRNSNDLPSALSRFIEQNTKNLPQVFSPLVPNPIRQSPTRNSDYLPSRRQNDGALDSYDTHIDRFAKSGPPNRIQIGDLSGFNFGGASNSQSSGVQPNQQIGSLPSKTQTQYIGPNPNQQIPYQQQIQQQNVQSQQILQERPQYQLQPVPQVPQTPKAIQPNKVDLIIGAMPTMPPINGYGTYAPAPDPYAIVPRRQVTPEEITGSYRQPISPIYNQRLPNGQLRNVKIDAVNEQ